jgi:hypothetical protein
VLPEPTNESSIRATVHPLWHVLAEKHRGEHGHVLQLLPEHRTVLRVVRADPDTDAYAAAANSSADAGPNTGTASLRNGHRVLNSALPRGHAVPVWPRC